MSTIDVLNKAIQTNASHYTKYGDSYLKVGKVMEILFPDGVTLKTKEDFTRFHLLEWLVGKICRYVYFWEDVKYADSDSIFDASVYAAMIASFDQEIREKKDEV